MRGEPFVRTESGSRLEAHEWRSVNHLVLCGVLHVEVRDVQRSDGIEPPEERRIHTAAASRAPQLGPHLPQGSQHPSPIKPLSLTVLTKGHLAPLSTPTTALHALRLVECILWSFLRRTVLLSVEGGAKDGGAGGGPSDRTHISSDVIPPQLANKTCVPPRE